MVNAGDPCTRLAIAMPTFYVSFRTSKNRVVGLQPTDFSSLASAKERVVECVRETVESLQDHELDVLMMVCDISDESGTVLESVKFRDLVQAH
jgi:hypothetical protein